MDNATKFHHPYSPYDIQLDLMQCVYDTLANPVKKVAIVESPTGTGKTLSLICSTLTWLRDNKADILSSVDTLHSNEDDSDDSEPEWVKDTYKESILKDKLELLDEYEKYLEELHLKENKIIKFGTSIEDKSKVKRRKVTSSSKAKIEVSIEDEDEFVAKPYESDGEETTDLEKKEALSKEVQELLAKFDSSKKNTDNVELGRFASASQNQVRIFFSSRTHSQLNQFAEQLKLTNFPSSFPDKVAHERVKYMPLGSKKQLCINPDVKKWKTLEGINDACSEVRRSKEGCPFYQNTPKWHNSKETNHFRDQVFSDIHDIEDIAKVGESLAVCPYYAARDFIPSSEIVTLPYQYLLSESTRSQLRLDLKGSIVVIDEAHNLVDTINSIHSAEISLSELKQSYNSIILYMKKFKSRLNPGNRVNLLKLSKLITVLINFITTHYKKPGLEVDAFSILESNNTDMLNVHRVLKYIKTSHIAYKLDTYIQKLQEKESPSNQKPSSQPLLYKISKFLECLNNTSSEGSFFFERGPSLRYMLLEPSRIFQDIIGSARCVILAGGTMEPVSQLLQYLVPKLDDSSITKFSCNHVIPDSHLRTYIVNEPQFEFTFEKRNSVNLVQNHLFNFYLELSTTIPKTGGIIGFFPSYKYLDEIIVSWRKAGLFEKLEKERKVFYEMKDGPDPLPDYTSAVANSEGAILFAIVGGKLSEGINFGGNLCRAIVMTGLPYPNVFSGELIISRKHLEEKVLNGGGSKTDANMAAKEFFENICMKAVNQSVGRSIRSINDYSLIYLLDKRYANANIQSKLSQWVRSRIQSVSTVRDVMASSKEFFDQIADT